MAGQIIPFTSDPAQTFSCTLNGISYDFYAWYNDRVGIWYFNITDTASQTSLARGIPILCGCDLLQPYGLAMGEMYAVDLAAAKTPSVVDGHADALAIADAGPEDLGDRVRVVFFQPGETLE
jgi:hypothetical protein